MILVFSRHARVRIREREAEESSIMATLKAPDKLIVINGLKKAVRRINGKVMIVIFEDKDIVKYIVTVIISSKVEKYLPFG